MHLVTDLAGRSPRLGVVWRDVVLDLRTLSVDGLGTLRNPVVAPGAA